MKKTLLLVCIALLSMMRSAWADGPMITWSQIAGVNPVPNIVCNDQDGCTWDGSYKPGSVAGILPSTTPAAIVGGKVRLNLNTGFIYIDVEGLSAAQQNELTQSTLILGSPFGRDRVGTIVCRRLSLDGLAWEYSVANTPPFPVPDGNGSYRGLLEPSSSDLQFCRENPSGTAFLLRGVGSSAAYLGFGIGRTIQSK
jgi:hypothetical protein